MKRHFWICPIAPLTKELNRSKLPHRSKLPCFMLQGGREVSRLRAFAKKIFLDHKISKLLFLYKRSYYIVISIYWEGLLTTFSSHYGFCLLSKDEKDYYKWSFMCFTLQSHIMQRADQYIL